LATPLVKLESIEEEKKWLDKEKKLWYPLGRYCPRDAKPGCWVYFIRRGKLVARAKADAFDPPSHDPKYTYTGKLATRGSWEVQISSMEFAKDPIAHPGFRGFRYVSHDEQLLFEGAFL
jgi:hypothetical protein